MLGALDLKASLTTAKKIKSLVGTGCTDDYDYVNDDFREIIILRKFERTEHSPVDARFASGA